MKLQSQFSVQGIKLPLSILDRDISMVAFQVLSTRFGPDEGINDVDNEKLAEKNATSRDCDTDRDLFDETALCKFMYDIISRWPIFLTVTSTPPYARPGFSYFHTDRYFALNDPMRVRYYIIHRSEYNWWISFRVNNLLELRFRPLVFGLPR